MIYIVVPTYNERDNISALIERVFLLGIPDLRLVVVDDNSPDGTADIVEKLAQKYPVEIIKREEKSGLGRAYIDAFKKILSPHNVISCKDADIIIQMDADLSHDPNSIPKMLSQIQRGCDVVLGSRYIKGGKIENWSLMRRLVSWCGNMYARLVLNLPYKDLTGGYKCWRAKVLRNLNLENLSSLGYNFQIETTYRAHKKGYKVCEVPIVFTERREGASKFNLGIILEAFWRVLMLRIKSKV